MSLEGFPPEPAGGISASALGGIQIAGPPPQDGYDLQFDAATGTARWRKRDFLTTFSGLNGAGNITPSVAVHAGDTLIAVFDGATPGFAINATSFTAAIAGNVIVQVDPGNLQAKSYFALVRPGFPT